MTRNTARRLAQRLGVDETQVIHLALHEMAVKLLPQYEADDAPLTAAQVRQIRKRAPQGKKQSVRSSLLGVGPLEPVRGDTGMTPRWWAEPAAGDIVWCHFPDDIHPRPKPRPALILTVFDDDAPQFTVRMADGTSQKATTLHRGEFSILRDRNQAAFEAAGLSHDTKFNLRQALHLPFTTEWCSVPPAAPHGQTPRLGTLHPSLVRAVQAALRAAAG